MPINHDILVSIFCTIGTPCKVATRDWSNYTRSTRFKGEDLFPNGICNSLNKWNNSATAGSIIEITRFARNFMLEGNLLFSASTGEADPSENPTA